jgi:hypothetical protein
MSTRCKRAGASAFVLAAILAFCPSASAQMIRPGFPVNANPQIAPGVSLLQYAYNTAVLGRAYSQVPPYMLGYPSTVPPAYSANLYSPALYNPNAAAMYAPPAIGGGYSPFGASPYAGGYSAGGIDPLTGLQGGYSGNPLGYGGGYGSYYGNLGPAYELMAYGQLGLDQEKARILRETANQAKLDTRKKLIDTLAYIRANEYTFTKEQADIAKRLVDRAQKTPTQTEIQSGKSLNILLKDLITFKSKDLPVPKIVLDEDVLKLVNVSGPGSSGGIGLLRNNGEFTWPTAFDNKDVISEKDKRDLDLEARQLFQQASSGTPDANMLRNVEVALRTARNNLAKQVVTMPASNYVDAQHFLDDFDSAIVAVRRGDVRLNNEFHEKFVRGSGSRTVQELVEYMGSKGIQFASSSPGEERANAALQAALAAHSVAIHAQVAASGNSGSSHSDCSFLP